MSGVNLSRETRLGLLDSRFRQALDWRRRYFDVGRCGTRCGARVRQIPRVLPTRRDSIRLPAMTDRLIGNALEHVTRTSSESPLQANPDPARPVTRTIPS